MFKFQNDCPLPPAWIAHKYYDLSIMKIINNETKTKTELIMKHIVICEGQPPYNYWLLAYIGARLDGTQCSAAE